MQFNTVNGIFNLQVNIKLLVTDTNLQCWGHNCSELETFTYKRLQYLYQTIPFKSNGKHIAVCDFALSYLLQNCKHLNNPSS